MKRSILLLFVAALTLGVYAGSVSPDMAIAAARAWVTKNAAFNSGTAPTGNVITERDPTNTTVVLWHQVSMTGGGMLVVAPVTEIEPVVVALDNDPGELPKAHPLRGILTGDMRRRLQFLGLYGTATPTGGASLQGATPTVTAVSEEAKDWGAANDEKWGRLLSGGGASLMEAAGVGVTEITVEARTVKGFEKGGALTHWNQSDYNGAYLYNLYTPKHAVCGCVATACGALAQFYGTTNAAVFKSTCSYTDKSNVEEKEYATMPGVIDWNILPENWGGTNAAIKATDPLTTEQQQLLGRVAYNAGVGVSMMWSDEASGAYTTNIVTALKEVFGFRHARAVLFEDGKNPDAEQLEKLIYNQVRAGVPVGLSIEEHAVVAAGYGLDADNVERVRVFMGWSGAGDGWYALPKIDTKATMNGGSYLSEAVNAVITMIAYDNDDIVPVVGHVSMPGAKLTIPALNREVEANEYGYFGTRVPANFPEKDSVVAFQGKEATFKIEDPTAAAGSSDAAALAEALPDAFEFALLNCTVAYSLERAKLLAEREGKAILRVSGTSSDSNTIAVLDHIYSLDADPNNDFRNKFVYVFSESDSLAGDGSDVSYGIYLPTALDPDNRWQFGNGALSYGFVSTENWETNHSHTVSNRADAAGTVSTNVYTYTFAPAGGDPVVTMHGVGEVDAITNAVMTSFLQVLDVGVCRFDELVSGITVEVTATSTDAVDAMGRHDGSYPAGVYDKCGLYEGCFAAGSNVTFVCNAEVTNETAGVVFGCAGWSMAISNKTTGATSTRQGTGTNVAEVVLAADDAAVLTWDLSRKVAVFVEVVYKDEVRTLDAEAVTPGRGWYAYGLPQTFQAKATVGKYGLQYFNKNNLPNGTIELSPLKVLVPMDAPGTVEAVYRSSGTPPVESEVTTTCAVTVHNYVWDVEKKTVSPADANVPSTMIYTQEGVVKIANGATADVPGVTVAGLTVAATTYTTADGVEMEFYGVYDGTDILLDQSLPLVTDFSEKDASTIMWCWKPADLLVTPEDIPTEFKVEWDDALSVLNASGFSTNLLTKAQLEKAGITIDDVTVSAPKGFTAKLAYDADGNVVATLELDEKTLQPYGDVALKSSPLTILSNGDGTVTVKADVANGVRGFWYTLYGSDNLADWAPVKTGYVAGTPSDQAKVDDSMVSVWIKVEPNEAKRFFKLVVTDVKPN